MARQLHPVPSRQMYQQGKAYRSVLDASVRRRLNSIQARFIILSDKIINPARVFAQTKDGSKSSFRSRVLSFSEIDVGTTIYHRLKFGFAMTSKGEGKAPDPCPPHLLPSVNSMGHSTVVIYSNGTSAARRAAKQQASGQAERHQGTGPLVGAGSLIPLGLPVGLLLCCTSYC